MCLKNILRTSVFEYNFNMGSTKWGIQDNQECLSWDISGEDKYIIMQSCLSFFTQYKPSRPTQRCYLIARIFLRAGNLRTKQTFLNNCGNFLSGLLF